MTRKEIFFAFLIAVTYLTIRLSFPNTIEFGYDQPRLATHIQDFLSRGSYLASQEFTQETPWGNISWGPALVFFFAFILKVSGDPIIASQIVAILNLISVLTVFYIGWKFFSLRIGVIAGFLLATQPWWVIFSRMIYQPSFVPTLISLSMLLTFLVLKESKNIFSSFLLFSWAVLIQFYLITLSFIATSFAFLLPSLRKWSLKWVFFGFVLSGVIFAPSIYYYKQNPSRVQDFLSAPGKFQTKTSDVVISYFKTVSGGNLEWELGYGYRDFAKNNPWIGSVFIIDLLLVTIVIAYSFLRAFISREDKILRVLLIFWCVAPLWFLSLVKVEYVVPRYFLISLPPLSLLIGLFVEDVHRKLVKPLKNFSFAIPIFLMVSWVLIILSYFSFTENYSYPNGFLSHFSDPPYVFLRRSFDYIISDARSKGYDSFTISNDPARSKENVFDWANGYMWNYVYKLGEHSSGRKIGHYLLYFKPPKGSASQKSAEFGPYIVYEVSN